MFRPLLVFLLVSSLIAICQTPTGATNNSGYIAPIMPGAPLVTPPNVALPGSGPATGAPVSIGVNDPRSGGSGSIYQPSAGTLMGTENIGIPSPAPITGAISKTSESTATATPNQPLNVGVASYSEAPANQPEVSLGDIARRYKAQRASQHPRTYDNSNIRHASYGTADTNAAALPQGDQATATYGSTGVASAPEGVLNPADYAAVQAALARSQAASNTSASSNTIASAMPDPNRSLNEDASSAQTQPTSNTNQQGTTEATTPQVDNQAAAPGRTNTPAKKQLPASATSLPMVGLLGLIALAIGGIFSYRLRRAE